jgi:hypothetical protein
MNALRARVLLLASGLLCSAGRADDHGPGKSNPLQRLFPSAAARALQDDERASSELTHTLEQLPDVLSARVQLTTPALESQPLDVPRAAARMSIVLRLRGTGPNDAQLLQLARVASHGPLEEPITVVRAQVPAARTAHATTVRVGPFEVLSSSALNLRVTLATCLLTNVCLATILLVQRRRRGPRNQQN